MSYRDADSVELLDSRTVFDAAGEHFSGLEGDVRWVNCLYLEVEVVSQQKINLKVYRKDKDVKHLTCSGAYIVQWEDVGSPNKKELQCWSREQVVSWAGDLLGEVDEKLDTSEARDGLITRILEAQEAQDKEAE